MKCNKFRLMLDSRVLILVFLFIFLGLISCVNSFASTKGWKFWTGTNESICPTIGPDGTIYSGSSTLYAIRSGRTPKSKWTFKFENTVWPRSSPLAIGSDGTIYVGADSSLYAIDPKGTLKWRYQPLNLNNFSASIGSDGTIYVGAILEGIGYLHAINPDGTLKWRFSLNGYCSVEHTAIGFDGTIFFVSYDSLYAINPDGTLKWRKEISSWGELNSDLAIAHDGTIYIAARDGYLYALNSNGSPKWHFCFSYQRHSSPSIGSDGTIYVGSDNHWLYAINPNGTLKWKTEIINPFGLYSTPAIGSDGTIYFAANNYIQAINSDGTFKWKIQVGSGYTYSSPVLGPDGAISIESSDGYLYVFNINSGGLANSPWPMFRHDAQHTGSVKTSLLVDTDNDGIPDDWEVKGYDHNGDGIIDVDLPGMGANPNRKDIFIEIDYMQASDHTHKPKSDAIKLVVDAFAKAPISNPDKSKGINLHVLIDEALPHQEVIECNDKLECIDSIAEEHFDKSHYPIFHYCLFLHNIETSDGNKPSGISVHKGSAFIVSLGGWGIDGTGTIHQQAGTFMHELGHNLGLQHGGFDSDINGKPNYLSIMNYFFIARGLIVDGKAGNMDFSRLQNITLNEKKLNELKGIGGNKNYGTVYASSKCEFKQSAYSYPIDWNNNGSSRDISVSVDVSPSSISYDSEREVYSFQCDSTKRVLRGCKDWDNELLLLKCGLIGKEYARSFGTPHDIGYKNELTLAEDSAIKPIPPSLTYVSQHIGPKGTNEISRIEWEPVGMDIITHYTIYLMNDDTRKIIGSVPSDEYNELNARAAVYSFQMPEQYTNNHKECYGVTAIDIYGNESDMKVITDF